MKRVAFTMQLKPGTIEEYERRHRALWPELQTLLKEQGIAKYHIYVDENTHQLFAYQEIVGDQNSQALGHHPIVQKWWAFMAELMEVNDDLSPVSNPLREVFSL